MYHSTEMMCNICIIELFRKMGRYEKLYGWQEK